jgi:uncharacterized protein (TIGR00369 family)
MTAQEEEATTIVRRLRALIGRGERLAPIARLVEAQLLEVDPGRVRVQYAVKPEFMHPGLAVQGGIVTVYADMAMALAAETLCEDGEIVVTSQLSISFLAPVTRGPVVAEGTVIKRGRSTFFLEAVVHDPLGAEVARATSVAAPRRRKAERPSLRAPDGVGAGEPEP